MQLTVALSHCVHGVQSLYVLSTDHAVLHALTSLVLTASQCVLQHDAMKQSLTAKQKAYGSFQEAVQRLDTLVQSHRQRVK